MVTDVEQKRNGIQSTHARKTRHPQERIIIEKKIESIDHNRRRKK